MSNAYRSSARNSGNGTAALCTLPTHSAGDIAYFLVLTSGASQTFSLSGWTQCADSPLKIGTESYKPECALFRRELTASEPSSYTCTLGVSRDWKTGIVIWSGQDANPIDDIAGAIIGPGSSHNTPSITNSDNNNWILHFVFTHNKYVSAIPSGYTERLTTPDATFDFSIFDSNGPVSAGTIQETYTLSGYDYSGCWSIALQVDTGGVSAFQPAWAAGSNQVNA